MTGRFELSTGRRSPTDAAEEAARPEVGNDPRFGPVARGGIWGLGGKVAVLGATMASTPFTIRLLGPEGYGIWSLVQVFTSYLVLADMGMSFASTKVAGDRFVRNDSDGESAAIWTALLLTLSVTTVAAMAVATVAPVVVGHLLHVSRRLHHSAVLAVRITALGAIAQSVAGTMNTPQTVRLRWRGLTLATAGPLIAQAVLAPLVLLATGSGLVAMAVITALCAVAGAVGNAALAVRLQPRLRRPRVERSAGVGIFRYGAGLTIAGFAAIPLASAERLMLAHFRAADVVAAYAVAASLAMVLVTIPVAATAPLFPALVRLRGDGMLDEVRRLYRQVLQVVFAVMTPASILLALVAGPFLRLWAGPTYARHSVGPFLVILVGLWFSALAYVPHSYLLAVGRTSRIAKIQLAELVPFVVGAALLTARYGAMGAALTLAARMVADFVIFSLAARDELQLEWSPLPGRRLAGVLAPAGLLGCALAGTTFTHALITRATLAMILCVVYGFVTWTVVLNHDERRTLTSVLGSLATPRVGAGHEG